MTCYWSRSRTKTSISKLSLRLLGLLRGFLASDDGDDDDGPPPSSSSSSGTTVPRPRPSLPPSTDDAADGVRRGAAVVVAQHLACTALRVRGHDGQAEAGAVARGGLPGTGTVPVPSRGRGLQEG